jgi:hypothetical protein
MKPAALLLIAVAAWAQPPLKTVSLVTPAEKTVIPFQTMSELEKALDKKVSLTGGNDPMLVLGNARTLYLKGFGAVVTQEVSLVAGPVIYPFRPTITPEDVVNTHKRKIERLPVARETIREMWSEASKRLTALPESEQIVMAVRLLYQPWEDTTGLPGQIVVKGTRKAGSTDIQIEEQ